MISIESSLVILEQIRSRLGTWGVTQEMLMAFGALSLIFFALSAREVMSWFFRISHLHQEVRELRGQLAQLQSSFDKVSSQLEQAKIEITSEIRLNDEEASPAQPTPSVGRTQFRLDH